MTTREAAVEILALRAFNAADRNGTVITRRMVDELFDSWAEHADGCGCEVHDLIPLTTAAKVFQCASRWQSSITTRSVHGAGPR